MHLIRLLELSFLADSNNMWFHVDNIFIGSLVILDSEGRHHMSHTEKSDSLTNDFIVHRKLNVYLFVILIILSIAIIFLLNSKEVYLLSLISNTFSNFIVGNDEKKILFG